MINNIPSYLLKNLEDKETDSIKYYPDKGKILVHFVYKIDKEKITQDYFRDELAGAIQAFEKENVSRLYVDLNLDNEYKIFNSIEYMLQSAVEGIFLGNYSFDKYKNEKKRKKLEVIVLHQNQNLMRKIISESAHLIDAVVFAKDLVNEPAISLTPKSFFQRIKNKLNIAEIKVTALTKAEMQKIKMNAILAVGNGSENPPYLIKLHYKPKQKPKKKIALVGKGVTYDTGGYSIKPTNGMYEMKADMAGAATVVGTILAAAKSNLPIELLGYIPAVENMISGKAYRPGDIIRSYSGKTIDVKDTDAEGRIVLADALTYACEAKPEQIIDFATLTGAVAVALGVYRAGVFTNVQELSDKLIDSGEKTYELLWQLPFGKEYEKLIKSDLADVSNLGPRWGGAITAGKFLEHFVDKKIPWVHIDLAGPALSHDLNSYSKKYNTGFGVRLMYDYLKNF
ncbi:MAG: leucyl aminopeptidase [Melioribacteraceae bacterium]|nr:leucyl aminopeptidase [Melioribacteraceae bacterium]